MLWCTVVCNAVVYCSMQCCGVLWCIIPIPQERVCEDSASFDLTSADIAHCITDVHHLLTVKKTEQGTLDEGRKSH